MHFNHIKLYIFSLSILLCHSSYAQIDVLKNISNTANSFINAEKISKKVLSFPHHQYLSEEEIMYVVECINKFYE